MIRHVCGRHTLRRDAPGTGRVFATGLGVCHFHGAASAAVWRIRNRQEISVVGKRALAGVVVARQKTGGFTEKKGRIPAVATQGAAAVVCRCQPGEREPRTAEESDSLFER